MKLVILCSVILLSSCGKKSTKDQTQAYHEFKKEEKFLQEQRKLNQKDSDFDGISDGLEKERGTDPLIANFPEFKINSQKMDFKMSVNDEDYIGQAQAISKSEHSSYYHISNEKKFLNLDHSKFEFPAGGLGLNIFSLKELAYQRKVIHQRTSDFVHPTYKFEFSINGSLSLKKIILSEAVLLDLKSKTFKEVKLKYLNGAYHASTQIENENFNKLYLKLDSHPEIKITNFSYQYEKGKKVNYKNVRTQYKEKGSIITIVTKSSTNTYYTMYQKSLRDFLKIIDPDFTESTLLNTMMLKNYQGIILNDLESDHNHSWSINLGESDLDTLLHPGTKMTLTYHEKDESTLPNSQVIGPSNLRISTEDQDKIIFIKATKTYKKASTTEKQVHSASVVVCQNGPRRVGGGTCSNQSGFCGANYGHAEDARVQINQETENLVQFSKKVEAYHGEEGSYYRIPKSHDLYELRLKEAKKAPSFSYGFLGWNGCDHRNKGNSFSFHGPQTRSHYNGAVKTHFNILIPRN